ncbi:hypothetical protein, partial [uncultured Desulfovibrio sp.]|uniref:hypothetical protein n=1 Tax=uncultured Desulfovibrio sp. TaxID=167968 RepID=UPI002804C3BF
LRAAFGRVTVQFLSVMYMSTLPPKIAHFLAGVKNSYFLGFLRRQPPPFYWQTKKHSVLCLFNEV